MKLIHLSDLHFGKKLAGYDLSDDQRDIARQILAIVRDEAPDAVLIAGDVYDKSIPSEEAVTMFDGFLTELSNLAPKVLVIAGNHDSSERVSFGGSIMSRAGVHMAPLYGEETAEPVTIRDASGMAADIFMLPFIKPIHVRRVYPDEPIESFTDAVRVAVSKMRRTEGRPAVLMAHQYVTGASVSGSESAADSVGGLDQVASEVFDGFDYAALGHIHRAQKVGRETIRYCGTPLRYSLSEMGQDKSVTVVEIGGVGDVSIRTVPLTPLHGMREIRGSFAELVSPQFREKIPEGEFLRVVLTDEDIIENGLAKLEQYYPHIVEFRYDNTMSRAEQQVTGAQAAAGRKPIDLFAELFESQNNAPMNDEEREYMETLIEEIWG